jgi:hypothetical protein
MNLVIVGPRHPHTPGGATAMSTIGVMNPISNMSVNKAYSFLALRSKFELVEK